MKRTTNADKKDIFLRYWRMLAPGMPEPEPEYQFVPGRKFRADWAFRVPRILVEVDGGVWAPGGGRHAKDSDREKTNLAAAGRWLVFRFSPQMLERDPTTCVDQVMQAIIDSE